MWRSVTAVGVVACVAAFWHLGNQFIAANGPTFDEAVHLAAGYSYWATGDFRVNVEDPPAAKLAWALPGTLTGAATFTPDPGQWDRNDEWLIGQDFLYAEPGRVERVLNPARRVNLLFGAGVVGLVGWWAYRAWRSRLAALMAAALAGFDPTLTALSGVLTTDAALTLFTTLTAYLVWEYAGRPDRRVLVAAGVCLGLALGSKFSAVASAAAVAAGVLAFVAAGGSFPMRGEPCGGRFPERLRAAAAPAVRVTVVALVVLAGCYGFVRFPAWGVGLKQQLARGAFGDPHFFFLGDVRTTGSPWYFPVALALKLPLSTTTLFALGVVGTLWGPFDRRWLLLAVPPVAFVAAMTAAGVDLGVRVVLPAVPFIYLWAARLAVAGRWRGPRLLLVAVGGAGAVFAGVRAAPHQLAYFTEPVGGPEAAVRLLGDSNLDWGQDLPAVRDFMERERLPVIALAYYGTCPPRYYGVRYRPLPTWGNLEPPPADPGPPPGRQVVAVSAGNLQGTYLPDPDTYAWLRSRKPVAVLGGSVWVFDLTDDPASLARLRDLADGSGSLPP